MILLYFAPPTARAIIISFPHYGYHPVPGNTTLHIQEYTNFNKPNEKKQKKQV